MKLQNPLFRRAAGWLSALAIVAGVHTAHAQGTAFTYQGRLNDTGNTANGSYDLTFSLFDSDTVGNQIGSTLTSTAVSVSNGLFVTTLDFGPGMFDGTSRWLEIGVSTNGDPNFATLSPRQALTPTPYAIYAANAANATSAASVASGVVAPDQLATPVPPNDGQVLAFTGGSLQWIDPAVAGGSVWSLNGSSAYYSGGRVGIGTSSPRGALHVASGGVAVTGASSPYTGAGQGAFLEYNGTYGGVLFAYDYGANAPLNLLLNSPGGNVGIGTLTPAAKLTVYDPASVSHRIQTGGGVNAWARVEFANANGQWDVGTSRGFNGDQLYFNREGAATSALALQPNGDATFGGNVTLSGSASVSHRIQTSGGVNDWTRIEFANANGQWNVGTSRGFNGDQLYFSRQGIPANALALQPNGDAAFSGNVTVGGNTSVCSLTIRGGCDVAEPFTMKEAGIQKGSVVVIDEEHPGQLKLSTGAYDTRVAGIVSGANGINPGIALHQEGALEGGQNVALTGRVYVQADAGFGAIKAGDMLTTSETPGCAMKVTDHARAQGAILGKAMSALKEGRGMVLVLVTLQ